MPIRPIRVAQVGTGNAGMLTLRQLITDDRFELVAVSVSSPDKVGRDAGELAGLDVVTGVAAVGDLDELVAATPECAVYCAMGDTRPVEATNDVRKLLEAGIDVVGSAPGTLQYPWGTMPEKVIAKVEESARAGEPDCSRPAPLASSSATPADDTRTKQCESRRVL